MCLRQSLLIVLRGRIEHDGLNNQLIRNHLHYSILFNKVIRRRYQWFPFAGNEKKQRHEKTE